MNIVAVWLIAMLLAGCGVIPGRGIVVDRETLKPIKAASLTIRCVDTYWFVSDGADTVFERTVTSTDQGCYDFSGTSACDYIDIVIKAAGYGTLSVRSQWQVPNTIWLTAGNSSSDYEGAAPPQLSSCVSHSKSRPR